MISLDEALGYSKNSIVKLAVECCFGKEVENKFNNSLWHYAFLPEIDVTSFYLPEILHRIFQRPFSWYVKLSSHFLKCSSAVAGNGQGIAEVLGTGFLSPEM